MDHGNSNSNNNPHHLYEIWDKKEDDVFKYGISDKTIEAEDGLSSRVRDQVYRLNLPENWLRFSGRILEKDIPNRLLAKRLEHEHINAYVENHGRRPRGNPLRRKSRFDPRPPGKKGGKS